MRWRLAWERCFPASRSSGKTQASSVWGLQSDDDKIGLTVDRRRLTLSDPWRRRVGVGQAQVRCCEPVHFPSNYDETMEHRRLISGAFCDQ